MAIAILLIAGTMLLAYSNGANDNFKGVATLFGSNILDYKTAIGWATITTFSGSISSIFLAQTLLSRFTGKGLVPDYLTQSPEFLLAVAIGAGSTVLLATLMGFPISTTHALVGGLAGGGFTAAGTELNVAALGGLFIVPLIASPLIAMSLGSSSYYIINKFKKSVNITEGACICVDKKNEEMVYSNGVMNSVAIRNKIVVDTLSKCETTIDENYHKLDLSSFTRVMHFLSSGMVSFARGLNDTPKIVALLLVIQVFDVKYGMLAVAVAMAIGGLINARKVATVMSKKITPIDETQGLSANLVTSFLVIMASRFGMPVSTAHVSVGAISGIGFISGKINRKVISGILASWVITLPTSALITSIAYFFVGI